MRMYKTVPEKPSTSISTSVSASKGVLTIDIGCTCRAFHIRGIPRRNIDGENQ